jgi:hypothetical protein
MMQAFVSRSQRNRMPLWKLQLGCEMNIRSHSAINSV